MKLLLTVALVAVALAASLWAYLQWGGAAEAATVAVGDPAPTFEATATGNQTVKLSDYRGQSVILVFYPMDNTPGCTIQLCALRDQWPRLETLNATVLGINPGSLKSHEAFKDKHRYPFPLVVDENSAIARAYGVKQQFGTNARTVVIIAPDGRIAFIERGLPPVKSLIDVVDDYAATAPTTEK